ncbi:hypothetical protein AB205_0182660 [Aquarana catesbeiana]|uniref:G-protein coupled receptors family 1 profile domain-containing protein n=1 Tax=Aquarana catesbeiana TaxID=8400 RepID=A0A2G9R4P2_AQUCT|nr:hypothetical protein AB205_0182660 [Aquarana catesbeiana]
MCQDNQTKVSEIHLLGVQGLDNFKPLFFAILLLLYIAIVTGNVSIILLVSTNSNLKIPMFIFLQHLAFADALIATCVIPIMAEIIIRTKKKMSVISSSTARKKSFSTCSAHLTSVAAYYGSLITIYVTPSNELSPSVNKYSSLLYIVMTPLMNPIIYSLRNQEIRQALHKKLRKIAVRSFR